MKKFIFKILLFIPILLFVVLTNYFVDPANLFRNEYEEGIADILIRDQNVENLYNYDERLVQKYYIEQLTECKDLIILGSSRTMQIDSALTDNDNMFNNSVSGASIADFLAIYQMYYEKDLLPKKVIIGIDPWMFNKNANSTRWLSVSNYYENMSKTLGIEHSNKPHKSHNKFLELFSLTYLQSALREIPLEQGEYIATNRTSSPRSIKLFDGSLVYGDAYRNSTPAEIKSRVTDYLSTEDIYFLGDYLELDQEYVVEFQSFLTFLLEQDTEVVLYLSPYHPDVYHVISSDEKYAMVSEVESFIKELGLDRDLTVIGSYNPSNPAQNYNLDSSNFYDGMHPTAEAIRIIFETAE